MTEINKRQDGGKEEVLVPELKPGLSAIPWPDLTVTETFGDFDAETISRLGTAKEVLAKTNRFLEQLTAQGASLVQVVEQQVTQDRAPYGQAEPGIVPMKIAIVNKGPAQPGK